MKEGRGVSFGIPQHPSFHPTHGTLAVQCGTLRWQVTPAYQVLVGELRGPPQQRLA